MPKKHRLCNPGDVHGWKSNNYNKFSPQKDVLGMNCKIHVQSPKLSIKIRMIDDIFLGEDKKIHKDQLLMVR